MSTIDELVSAVAAEDTVIDSAVLVINGLNAQIASLTSATTDPATAAKISALQADVSAKTAALSAAIVVGTAVPPVVTPTTPVVTPADANAAATASVSAVKGA